MPPSVLIPAKFPRGGMLGGEHHLHVQWVQYRKGAQTLGSPHLLHLLLQVGGQPASSPQRDTPGCYLWEDNPKQTSLASCLGGLHLWQYQSARGRGLPSVSGAFLEGWAECSRYWTDRDCVCSLLVQPTVYKEPSALF